MATGSHYKYYYYSSSSQFNSRLILLFGVSISIYLIGILPTGASGTLTITKECGEIVCKSHQYCSRIDHLCRPCQVACDPALGNYDKSRCENDCQDYLHDLWYMRKSDNNETGLGLKEGVYLSLYYKMEEDLRLLKILIGVVIILSTCVMLALFAVMIYFKKIKNRLGCYHADGTSCDNNYNRKKKKLMDLPVIYSNNKVLSLTLPDFHNDKGPPSHRSLSSINNNISRGSTPDLVSRSNSSSLPQDLNKKSGVTQAERQQKFRREPSESTLPEYLAYDNPALVPSPTHM